MPDRRLTRKPQMHNRIELAEDIHTLARQRTIEVFDSFDHVFVAFSGGKDSTSVLNIALDVAHSDPRFARHLPLRVVFQDEEAIPMETEEYVRRTAQRDDVALEWYCIPLKHRNACSRTSPDWWPWAPEARELWCRPLPPEALTTLDGFPIDPPQVRLSAPDANGLLAPPRLGNVAMLMGIRAQESVTRRRAVMRRREGERNYIVKSDIGTCSGNFWKAYPIYDWTTEDVWTMTRDQHWDYNAAYDRMEMAGVSHMAQRCSPAFGEEPLGKLWTYAHCFPEVWAKMVERVPGVGAAVRYATTELYGYRGYPTKPTGVTWPAFLLHFVEQFGPESAPKVAKRLRIEIRRHYRKTATPIAVKTRHPESGISWKWMMAIAMRGDFKERRQSGDGVDYDPVNHARQWAQYIEEIDQIVAAGTFAELGHPGPPPEPRQLVCDCGALTTIGTVA